MQLRGVAWTKSVEGGDERGVMIADQHQPLMAKLLGSTNDGTKEASIFGVYNDGFDRHVAENPEPQREYSKGSPRASASDARLRCGGFELSCQLLTHGPNKKIDGCLVPAAAAADCALV